MMCVENVKECSGDNSGAFLLYISQTPLGEIHSAPSGWMIDK